MGAVYEAIQENPERRVAIKVMRNRAASRDELRRFDELAGAVHPPQECKVDQQ